MSGIKSKDLIMLGLIIGIALFFVGAMINNVFPSSETDLLGYKVSAFVKMIGLGFVVSSMIVGGVIVEDIDKNLKILLLLLGLILLLVYTIGAQQLHWDISSYTDDSVSESEAAYKERPQGYGTPGFEIMYTVVAIIAVILIAKVKRLKQ